MPSVRETQPLSSTAPSDGDRGTGTTATEAAVGVVGPTQPVAIENNRQRQRKGQRVPHSGFRMVARLSPFTRALTLEHAKNRRVVAHAHRQTFLWVEILRGRTRSESILIRANVHGRTETDALQARVTVAELNRGQLRRRDTIPRSKSTVLTSPRTETSDSQ